MILRLFTRQYSGLVRLGHWLLVRKKDELKLSRSSLKIVMDNVIHAECFVAGTLTGLQWGLEIGAFAGGDVGSAVAGAAAGSALQT